MPDNDGVNVPWVVLDRNLPSVTQVEDIALEPAEARPPFPPENIHSLLGVRERLRGFLREDELDAVTEDTPDTQTSPSTANQSDAVLTTLNILARRREEVINEIEQSRQRFALNEFAGPSPQINRATLNPFSNPAVAQSVLPTFEHLNCALAPLPVQDSIMPQQEDEGRGSGLLGSTRNGSQANFVPPLLTRQNAFIFPPFANTIAGSGVTPQAETFPFPPFQWPTQETTSHGQLNSVQNVIPPELPDREWQQGFGSQLVTQETAASSSYQRRRDDFRANQGFPNVVFPTFEWSNRQDMVHPGQNLTQSAAQVASSNEQRQPFFDPHLDQAIPYANSAEQSAHRIQVPVTTQWQSGTPSSPSGSEGPASQILEQETQAVEQGSGNNTEQIWDHHGSRTEELFESLDSLERRQSEVRSEIQEEFQTQRAELGSTLHPPARSRANSPAEHRLTTLPPLPREPLDNRTSNPDAPPTPGRRAPIIRRRRQLMSEVSQDSYHPDEHVLGYVLHRVSRRRAEAEPEAVINIHENGHETPYTYSPYSAIDPLAPPPRPDFARLALLAREENNADAEPDRLLAHYRTQRVSPSQPLHHGSSAHSSRYTSDQWPDADPRSQTQRELDGITSYLALLGCFTDSRAELHRTDDISASLSPTTTTSTLIRHSRHSSRHHPYSHHHQQHQHAWTTSAQILAPDELRCARRVLHFRAAYGQRSGFRDALDDAYGPVVGEWLWWVWLGAAATAAGVGAGDASEADEEAGWVDLFGRRVLGGRDAGGGENGGVSGAGALGAGRWVERGGVGGFEIGIPGMAVDIE